MNYSILQKIIGDLESFEAEKYSNDISMEDFVGFLNQKYLGRILSPQLVEAPTENEENNIHEKNTGMEIIKRLINNQLLEQHDDENDKRSKRLKITPLGQAELFKSFDGMIKVSRIISGKLSDTERL